MDLRFWVNNNFDTKLQQQDMQIWAVSFSKMKRYSVFTLILLLKFMPSATFRAVSPKHEFLPDGFEARVAKGGKIKDKTRFLFGELLRKPLVANEIDSIKKLEEIPEDEFFKSMPSKVPSQKEIDRSKIFPFYF